jgi:hypothetical protein
MEPSGDRRLVFASPFYFRLAATLALGLALLAGYRLFQGRLQAAGQWLYLALIGGLAAGCLLAWAGLDSSRAQRLAGRLRAHPLLLGIVGLLAAVGGLAGWVATAQTRWAWAVLPQIAWLALTLLIVFVLIFTGQPRDAVAGVAGRAVFVLACVLLTYLALDLILRAVPALVPESAWSHLTDPGLRLRSYYAFFDQPVAMGYRYRPSRDDWVPCRNTGLPAFRVRWTTDENGFRNTPPLLDRYDLVAVGDSFTGGDLVNEPWSVLLARATGLSTLNLGIRGWGPQAEAEAVQAFGLAHDPSWVLVGFYEGNDLLDAANYEEIRASGLSWVDWMQSTTSPQPMDSWLAWQSLRYGLYDYGLQVLDLEEGGKRRRRFPLTVEVGGKELSLGFYDRQTAFLSATQEDIGASSNYALTEAALSALKEACDAQGVYLLLAYLPSKEHVYLPLIHHQDALATILAGAGQTVLDEKGDLVMNDSPLAPEMVWAHLDDQKEMMKALADRLDIGFLDLTPVFQSETAQGQQLYFPMDAHWTQDGHQLAADTIAGYLEQHSAAPVP